MRLFLAVFPPPPTQQAAFGAAEALRRPGDGVSWVRAENLHFTLRFLGDLGADGAERAAGAAREAARAHAPFDAALGPLGAFPNPRRARVIWVSLSEGGDAFKAMARDLEQALRRTGFGRADKPFSPHLTLGRVRQVRDDWSEKLAAVLPAGAVRFRVGAVRLMRSELSPKGARYTVRAEALLGG